MSWLLAGEPPLDLEEIQGHILLGFGAAPQALGAFTANDGAAASRLVGNWAMHGRITSAARLRPRQHRRAREVIASSGPWIAIAVSRRLLEAAGVPAHFDDEWFLLPNGMSGAGGRLSDPPPDDWVVGPPKRLVDVLVVAAAGTTSAALDVVEYFRRSGGDWIEHAFVEALSPLPGGIEHFGFRDGISQPAILGTADGEAFEAKRLADDGGAPFAAPGQALTWPGQFVFGYEGGNTFDPRAPGTAVRVDDAATNEVARNGSLLVYRRLTQNVSEFRSFCAEQATALQECLGADASPEQLQALLVGRRKSGIPLSGGPDADPNDAEVLNGFTFEAGDPMDAACPLSAHIRKVNPREGLRDTDAVPRILRRGAPFGPPYAEGETPPPAGRGLAFISYQTRIIEQFGTLTSHWMNDPLLPPGEGGHDLLVGQVPASQQRSLELAGHDDGVCTVHAGTRSWVNVTGGAFLFAPSLGVLRSLADGPVGRG